MSDVFVDKSITDPVIKVNGLCYELVGSSAQPVDSTLEEVFTNCDDCNAEISPSPSSLSPSPSPIASPSPSLSPEPFVSPSDPGLPLQGNIVAHYLPEGVSRHGLATINGDAQLDTAVKKFDNSSLETDGTGDDIEYADSSDLTFTGNLTIEGFLNTDILSHSDFITAWSYHEDGSNFLSGSIVHTGPDAGKFYIQLWVGGVFEVELITLAALSTSTQYHIAVARVGSTWTLYLEGVAQTSLGGGTDFGGTVNFAGPFRIGSFIGSGTSFWNGHEDEFRISIVARYTTDFTPPTGPFKYDTDTVLLLHFEGTDASTRIFDSAEATNAFSLWVDESGNEHDMAQLTGANQPLGVANALDGFTGSLFDGSTDFMNIPDNTDMDQTGDLTFVVVMKTTDADGIVYAQSDGITPFTASSLVFGVSGGKTIFRRGDGEADTDEWTQTGLNDIDDGVFRSLVGVDDGATMAIYLNNVLDVDSTPAGYTVPGTTTDQVYVGRRVNTGSELFFSGTVVEMILYTVALDTAQLAQLQEHLDFKYPTL